MTSDEKKVVELLGVENPIESVTLLVESGEDKNVDIKINYEVENYHITGGELFLYIKKNSPVKVDKVIRNKDIQQINMDLKDESNI